MRDNLLGRMVENIMDFIKMIKSMVMENFNGLMVESIKEIGHYNSFYILNLLLF